MKVLFSALGLVFLATTLGSCRPDLPPSAGVGNPAAAPVKTANNKAYRTPPVRGPVPRNPDMAYPSNFSNSGSISFSVNFVKDLPRRLTMVG
jgi:hypothetical protein